MSVKRYFMSSSGVLAESDGSGMCAPYWIRDEDFAALAAENDGLRAVIREMGEFLEYCRSSEVDEYDIDPLVKKITESLSRKAAP